LNLALLFVDIRELLLVGLTLMADLQNSFEHKIAKNYSRNTAGLLLIFQNLCQTKYTTNSN
jgi:hypothetical protein